MRAVILGLILLTSHLRAETIVLPNKVVVELFTSQGCSSCPPADAVLRELATQPEILALSFHVTYWNSLGWSDPYSLDLATSRQRNYQRSFDANTIYTPQIVVQGSAEMVGSDRSAVFRAIELAAASNQTLPSLLIKTTPAAADLTIEIGSGAGSADILLIGYDHQHRTAIARGENAGRDLVEANIVRSLRKIGSWTGAKLSLTTAVPIGEEAAIVVQAADGRILGSGVVPKLASKTGKG